MFFHFGGSTCSTSKMLGENHCEVLQNSNANAFGIWNTEAHWQGEQLALIWSTWIIMDRFCNSIIPTKCKKKHDLTSCQVHKIFTLQWLGLHISIIMSRISWKNSEIKNYIVVQSQLKASVFVSSCLRSSSVPGSPRENDGANDDSY